MTAPGMPAPPFFTIGHSTRSIEEFTGLLREAGVEQLVDVRTVPRSRTNPQFNRDSLPESLEASAIGYSYLQALGGLRPRSKTVATGVNGFWENASFHNYADYALGDDFRAGFAELLALGHHQRSAIMCAEAVWWRCHRRILADHLLARGEQVFHILGPGHIEPAMLTRGAVVQADGSVQYPAPQSSLAL